jgi:hypothetical protein
MPKFLANGSRLNANHSASLAGRSACLHADLSKSLLNATSRAIFKVSRRHAHRLRHLMRCPRRSSSPRPRISLVLLLLQHRM